MTTGQLLESAPGIRPAAGRITPFLVARVHLANGDRMEIPLSFNYLESLHVLKARGLTGKKLVHALLTGDWATPPAEVELLGETADGVAVRISIPYA